MKIEELKAQRRRGRLSLELGDGVSLERLQRAVQKNVPRQPLVCMLLKEDILRVKNLASKLIFQSRPGSRGVQWL